MNGNEGIKRDTHFGTPYTKTESKSRLSSFEAK